MPLIISSVETEKCLRNVLRNKGYQLSCIRENGETGVDILARMEDTEYHIEVIGYKSSGPARAKDFYEAFFRAISRLKDEANTCVIALPDRVRIGLPIGAKQYGIAWNRIGQAFPKLEIWLVDVDKETFERTKWNDWLSY